MSNVPQQTQAITKAQPTSMKGWISQSQNAFKMVLPKALTPERFVRIAHSALTKSPKLELCEPRDLVIALLNIAQLGLEPNTPLGHAYLIPYKGKRCVNGKWIEIYEPQVILGYQGILQLMWNSGFIDGLSADLAYTADEYLVTKGSDPRIVHVPVTGATDRGKIVGGYMATWIKGAGRPMLFSMSIAQILEIRDNHGNTGEKSPWNTNFEGMALKTIIRHGSKVIPKAPESLLARATQLDERSERNARPILNVEAERVDNTLGELPQGLKISEDDTRDDEEVDADGVVTRQSATDKVKAAAGIPNVNTTRALPEPTPMSPMEQELAGTAAKAQPVAQQQAATQPRRGARGVPAEAMPTPAPATDEHDAEPPLREPGSEG